MIETMHTLQSIQEKMNRHTYIERYAPRDRITCIIILKESYFGWKRKDSFIYNEITKTRTHKPESFISNEFRIRELIKSEDFEKYMSAPTKFRYLT